ncbi:hypothetical protein [Flagellimonas sp.]|uniref:hypothetical protein n=1 Tax=Flagellimonas sp. TaxID=2058762 RepID=UPI003B5B12F1
MKTTACKLFTALITLTLTCSVFAQEKTTQAFWVHEDQVKPSMLMEYEKAAKELVDNCKKHDIKTLGWLASQTDDFRYLFVSPISSMADISYDGFKPLREKMGADAFDKMFSDMDKCYSSHGDYVLILDHDLSYMPDGMTQTPEGQDYRRFFFLHTTPGDLNDLTAAIKDVKKMYEEKGSKSHYRIYRSGFGNVGNYFMVAVASKDGISYETQGAANDKLLGPEAQEVFGKAMKYVTKMEEVSGRIRPDLTYSPSE